MKTKLIEFKNQRNDILRGVWVESENCNKNHIVIMLGGFERAASTERKFKLLADELAKQEIDSLRMDIADVGLSDGDFYQMTMQSISDDLLSAIETIRKLGYKKISFIGHSQAACNVSLLFNEINFEKIVLLAPALNQKDLQRLWFVQEKNPTEKIGWNNYLKYFDEEEFQKTISQDVQTKSHILSPEFKRMNSTIDYAQNFHGYDLNKILAVLGDSDKVCPMESQTIEFPNKIILQGGDHDMEKPNMITQWINDAVSFLSLP